MRRLIHGGRSWFNWLGCEFAGSPLDSGQSTENKQAAFFWLVGVLKMDIEMMECQNNPISGIHSSQASQQLSNTTSYTSV